MSRLPCLLMPPIFCLPPEERSSRDQAQIACDLLASWELQADITDA